MMICLLVALAITVISGLGLYGADQGLGPLAWLANPGQRFHYSHP